MFDLSTMCRPPAAPREPCGRSRRTLLGPPSPCLETNDVACFARLAPRCPRLHERPALFEDVRAPVGPFDSAADFVAHCLLDDGVGNRRDFFGPSPERRPEPVGRDRPRALRINPLGLFARIHALQESQERHVRKRLAARLPWKDKAGSPRGVHLAHNFDCSGREGDAEGFLAMRAILEARQRYRPHGFIQVELIPCRLQHGVRTDVGQDQELKRSRGDRVPLPQGGKEGWHLLVAQRWMTALAEAGGRVKAHRLQVRPSGRVVRHGDPVLVSEHDAGALEDPADRGIELTGDFGLSAPDWPQHSGDVQRRDLIHRPVQQRPAVGRAKMALPLVADLRVDGLALRVGDDGTGNVAELDTVEAYAD
jgi:hypothetical protein